MEFFHVLVGAVQPCRCLSRPKSQRELLRAASVVLVFVALRSLFSISIFFSVPAFAQNDVGSIVGFVSDSSGAVGAQRKSNHQE